MGFIKKAFGTGMCLAGSALTGTGLLSKYIENTINEMPFYTRWPTQIYMSLMPENGLERLYSIRDSNEAYMGAGALLLMTGLGLLLDKKNDLRSKQRLR